MGATVMGMPAWTALLAALLPLVTAAGCALPSTRRRAQQSAPFAALPALAVAALGPEGTVRIGWLLDDITVTVDSTGRAFLLLTAFIWTAAGIYANAHPPKRPARFFGWFSLSMAGNLALCCVTDPAGFYTFFSTMALSAYALVVHEGGRTQAAGRAYMAFTVFSETLLVSGLFVVDATAAGITPGQPLGRVGVTLILAAFGTKIGALGLHGWMPASYSAAPTAAAAALAGSMSTAGVLGLLRFLPGGGPEVAAFGPVVVAFGLAAAFYGAAVGLMQTEPKVVLAYSSMSQFGLMTIAIGVGLTDPLLWPVAVTAATVYAVHHGLAKAALFIGEDIAARSARRWLPVAVLSFPALALAGAPLTSGAIAKTVLKEATASVPDGWHTALDVLLPLAAVATTLIMARFMYLVATRDRGPSQATREAPGPLGVGAWVLLLAAMVGTLWLWPTPEIRHAADKSLAMPYLWNAAWPLALGLLLAASAWLARGTVQRFVVTVPPGDVYAPLLSWSNRFVETRDRAVHETPTPPIAPTFSAIQPESVLLRRAGVIERRLLTWTMATSAVGALTVLFLLTAT